MIDNWPPTSVAITELEASVTEPSVLLAVMVNPVVTLCPGGAWPRVGVKTSASSTVLISFTKPLSLLTGVPDTVNVPPSIVPPNASANVPSAGLDIVTVTVSAAPTCASVMTTLANAAIGVSSDVASPVWRR